MCDGKCSIHVYEFGGSNSLFGRGKGEGTPAPRPREACSKRWPTDISAYLKQFPGVLKTFSAAELEDDADFNARTTRPDKNKKKKKKKDRRSRRDASQTGTTKTTKTTTAASKWIDPATVAAPATSQSRASGRTRKQVQKCFFYSRT